MNVQFKQVLFLFFDKQLTTADFEQWLYHDKELEHLDPVLYEELILFEYTDKNASHRLQAILERYIDRNEFNIWRTAPLLKEIIEDKIDIILATRKLRDLYNATGENFIQKAFFSEVGISKHKYFYNNLAPASSAYYAS